MNNKETVARLTELAQLEIDLLLVYDAALEGTDDDALRTFYGDCRDAHFDQLRALARLIRDRGAVPPEYSADFSGFLVDGMMPVARGSGERATLVALRDDERLCVLAYEDSMRLDLRADVQQALQRHRDAGVQRALALVSALERASRGIQPAIVRAPYRSDRDFRTPEAN